MLLLVSAFHLSHGSSRLAARHASSGRRLDLFLESVTAEHETAVGAGAYFANDLRIEFRAEQLAISGGA